MELLNVLRRLEEVDRQIAAYDKDIQDAAELALLRMNNTSMLTEFRDVVILRRDAMLRRDALVRLGTVASSSASSYSTVARDEASEAERQAKEEAEQKAKAEAERKDN